jgi:type IV pilus assembly protein PilV
MIPMKTMKNLHKQGGSGLIEVIVALVVLAVGLLGITAMQTKALSISNNSYLYSQAVFLAEDILERMRANRLALASYQTGFGDPVPAAVDCTSADCAPADIAGADLSEWKQQVVALLPSGESEIIVTGVLANEIAVIVRFDDEHDTSDLQSYLVRTRI